MNAPIYVTPPPVVPLPEAQPPQAGVVPQLLRQLIGLQQQQNNLLKTMVAQHDSGTRWRNFLTRWGEEFPNIGPACKRAAPVLERAYLSLLRELTDRVNAADADDLENEFALGEFLDRFGMRLGQLSNILGQVGPLADATPAPAPPPDPEEQG
ncbi:Uncharacterized protein OS=Rhodopirellula baltica SWK14 GN=RBSWK_00030 PE=4 SV=1 [Gemmataceae bacterium]|nr:Uncharacterized protein OS=Rhodopirellula baltica SWK14 GN=RBSWK_00030 PE=4 SV=1 [Gemmataceae bacterium]VTU01585.1 Uncharacterized protein OS=Rhodopirellula baltica SWK14 GN=RBSWK_00030 PE=4 SV=1 [Gemmataceae bacterium]